MFVKIALIIMFNVNCDSLNSKLYTFGTAVQQVRKCACMRRYDFKKIVNENCELLSEASKCVELEANVDSLKREIKLVMKSLN